MRLLIRNIRIRITKRSKVKAAFINSVAGFGSTGRLVEQLSQMPGIEGKIYYGRGSYTGPTPSCRFAGFFDNALQAADTFLFDRHALSNTRNTQKAMEDLKQFNPDLVHLHNLHGYYLNMETVFQALTEMKVPVIWTLHDCWSFTGHCAHYDSLNCEQWKSRCVRCPKLNTYPYQWNGSHVSENFELKKKLFHSLGNRLTLVAPSDWLKSQLEQSFLKDVDCRVIHNGIDLNTFHPVDSGFRKEHDLEGKRVYLAVASLWTKAKGFDDLVQISAHLPEDEALVVVGVSRSQQRRLTVPGVIALERLSSASEMAQVYSAADVLLNPTYEDTFPTVNLEAQACGCGVVTYRTGGSPEMITEKTGAVVAKGNCQALMKAAGSLSVVREDCIRHAQQFTKEKMLNQYFQLYKEKADSIQ